MTATVKHIAALPVTKSAIRNRQSAIDLALFIFLFLLYTSTLIPSILSADNGELQLVAWKLGIAHPPGYPLYTIIGFFFSRLFASPAYALSLLSAILAAITLVIVSRSVRIVTGSTIAGLAAAIILGTSTTFWAQATTANIRMPTAFFSALCAYICVRYNPNRSTNPITPTPPYSHTSDHYLNLFALTFSLGLTHHPSLIFPGFFFILYIALIDPSFLTQPRRWIKPLLFFALGLFIFLYLPLRAATGGTLANGEATSYLTQPDKLLDHILARGFEGDFFYFINTRLDRLDDRLSLLPTLFNFQFNIGALILGILGSIMLALRNRRLLIMLLGGILLHTFVTLTYRAPQTVEYAIPAYVLFSILIGCGIGYAADAPRYSKLKPAIHYIVIAIALLTALTRGLDNWPSYRWLAQNEDTRAYAEALLHDVPPNTLLLSNWHWANPLWYLQQVESLRADVEVRYVFPRGEPLADTWLHGIDDGIASGKPVVVDMAFRQLLDGAFYFFEPISRESFLVTSTPRNDLPAGFTPLEIHFADQFTLIGYRLLDDHTTPGEPLTFFLAWRVEQQPDRNYSFFVHLVDTSGRVIGQSDRAIRTMRYRPGDVIVERFFVAPLPDTSPGDYTLDTGIYSVDSNILVPLSDNAEVTHTTIDPSTTLTSQPSTPAVALSNGIYLLTPLPYSDTPTLSPGTQLTFDLTFLATRPLTRDYVVSIQMIGEDYSWVASSDSVPALGAIPTLKWIAGSTIVDRHVIDIPLAAPSGPASAHLILYDSFTQEPLALLDAQLIQQAPSIPLGVWTITP